MTHKKHNTAAGGQRTRTHLIRALILAFLLLVSRAPAMAGSTQTLTSPMPTVDVNSSSFKLIICDGPDLSGLPSGTEITMQGQPVAITHGTNPTKPDGSRYIPCDFNGAMMQVQHFINIAMVAGVLVAILGFSYAGFLFITGTPGNISRAKEIFPKVGIGFIIMLSAWFIVYQLLSWLTGGSGFSALLGTP